MATIPLNVTVNIDPELRQKLEEAAKQIEDLTDERDVRGKILDAAVAWRQRIFPDDLGNGWIDSIDRLGKAVIKYRGKARYWKDAYTTRVYQVEFMGEDLSGVYELLEDANVPELDGTNTERVKWLIEQWQRYESTSK